MAQKCLITVKDEVWCFLTGLHQDHVEALWKKFGVFVDGYFFMPAYKLGRWDGKIRFFEKTGKTYVRMLDKVVPMLEQWGYDIDLVDNRQVFKTPPIPGIVTKFDEGGLALEAEGTEIIPGRMLGNRPFALRPYQLQCVQDAIKAGSGFIIAGTGAGKTSITAGISYFYGEQGYKVITIVPSGDLVDQTVTWYEMLGLDVGEYSGENKDIDHTHIVATWQALQYNPHILQHFQGLIWDECFSGETQVLCEDLTWKEISNVAVGDTVISMNSSGEFESKPVLKVHINLPKSAGKMLRQIGRAHV